MNLQHLIYFTEIAKTGSFNKAAANMLMTQPNLTKAIRNLEDELRIQVFIRTNKGVTLTDEGKKLYQYCTTILNQMELIEGLATAEVPHQLSIASYPIITMGRLVADYYNLHRNENIEIKLVEKRMQAVLEEVESGAAEVGFIMCNEAQGRELRHTLLYKGLQMHQLYTDTWFVNLGPQHPLYNRASVTMQELLKYPFIRLPDDYFSNLTFYLTIDNVRLTEFKRVMYASDSTAIINALRRTDVIRFGPAFSKKEFEEYGIRSVPIERCNIKILVGWIQQKHGILSREAQDFIALLEQACVPFTR